MNPPDAGRHGKHCPPPTLTGPLYPQQLFHCHKVKGWYIPASGSSINSIGRLVSNNPLGEEKRYIFYSTLYTSDPAVLLS